MTEWRIFECDVCEKEMKYKVGSNTRPHILKLFENGKEEDEMVYDLCEDCWFLILSVTGEDYKEHAELADKLVDKKEGNE